MDLRRLFAITLVIAAFVLALPAHAALDNKGKEFLMAFLRGYSSPTPELHLTADVSTTVTVEYPVGTVVASVVVNPGAITVVSIPTSAHAWLNGVADSRVVRATAAEEFVCYMVNREPYTSDAALALPLETFNTEFIVATYNNLYSGDAEFAVVAGYDNTTVTITPRVALTSGRPAGVPFTITLNKGQGAHFSGSATGITGDPTGSIITADKPISLVNGNKCTYVPPTTSACDHIFEVAQPTQTWGKRVLMRNVPDRPSGTVYRILASQNATSVTRNGTAIGTINRGQFIEVGPIAGDVIFESANPIFVVQYITGQGSIGATTGDPAMGNGIPTDQFLKRYTFSSPGNGQFTQNYVTIVAANADLGSLELDGVAIPAADFTAIGTTGFSATIKSITSGAHTTSSTNPHGIMVKGYTGYDSYLYPGGALFQLINPAGDANPPECGELAYDGFCAGGTATDNRPSEDLNGNEMLDSGEDLNGNAQIDTDAGIYFIELASGSTNLTLTHDAFVPGAGSVNYEVCLTDNTIDGSGTIIVTDGAGNTCSTEVEIVANRAPEMVCLDEAVTRSADANCSVSVIAEDLIASVSDPDDSGDETSWTLSMSPEGPFGLGTHTITITATDDRGASDVCEATLIVVDDIEPTPDVAELVTLTDECSVTITTAPTATDNCAGPLTGTTTDPLTYNTQGTHTVTWTYDDGHGNTTTQTQSVVIDDNTAPTMTLASIAAVWPANHAYRTFTVSNLISAISDNCPGLAVSNAVITGVTSDEPEDATGNGDGNTLNDIVVASDCKSVDLRAERNGTGNGRVYRVYVSVTDAGGNTTTGSVAIGVPKNNNGTAAVENSAVYSVSSACASTLKPVMLNGGLSMSLSIDGSQPNPFDQFTSITYTVAEAGSVVLSIHDMTGQPIATLVNGEVEAGTHSVRFDAGDNPNGAYFAMLVAGGSKAVHHIVLQR